MDVRFFFSNSTIPPISKEKADYFECTTEAFKTLKFQHLLVIQDDVVAKEKALENILKVNGKIILRTLPRHVRHYVMLLKLFKYMSIVRCEHL